MFHHNNWETLTVESGIVLFRARGFSAFRHFAVFMDHFFAYKSVWLFFFFLQGLVFAFLLLRKGLVENRSSSQWLSLFIFLCCLYICPWMLGHDGWYGQDGYREFLFFVPFQQFYLLGPVIYFYTHSLLDPAFRLQRRDVLHFVPAFLYLLYSLIVFVTDQFVLEEYYFYADGRDKDLAPWYQISGLTAMIGYVVLSIRLYNRYRRRIFAELSYADTVLFDWMRRFLLALLLILTLRILFLIISPQWGDFGTKFWYYFFFACLYYYIALAGYSHAIAAAIPLRFSTPEPKIPLESVSPAPDPDLTDWKQKVQVLMEQDRLFENPTLTLTDVAAALDTTSRQVSIIINQGFAMNFNDFVNEYRIEAVKQRLAEGDQARFTLLSIALDCGFNSKTTFNRVFKKRTGLTPKQYLDQFGGEEAGNAPKSAS